MSAAEPAIRLDCPLCGAVAAQGDAIASPGRCPGCGATFAGGGPRPHDAAADALAALGRPDLDADVLTTALFAIEPGPDTPVAVTSDRRDGFYGWWVFTAPGGADALLRLAAPSRA